MSKKIIYFDMDGVLVDLAAKIATYDKDYIDTCKKDDTVDCIPDLFLDPHPMAGAIDVFNKFVKSDKYDVYILSTAPWDNSTAWSDKVEWVKKYLGVNGYKRLILSHHKNLNAGDYLIDDRTRNGADKFTGEHIHFGQDKFTTWVEVLKYLMKRLKVLDF